jgi:hypothetical protein
MDIKVRSQTEKSIARMHTKGTIRDIKIDTDNLVHYKESVSICFKSKESSGIITLSPKEIDRMVKALRRKRHLIKDVKIYKEDGV